MPDFRPLSDPQKVPEITSDDVIGASAENSVTQFVDNRPEASAFRSMQSMADSHVQQQTGLEELNGQTEEVVQMITFSRLQGLGSSFKSKNSKEEDILDLERRLFDSLAKLQPYKNSSEKEEIHRITTKAESIQQSTISEDFYDPTLRSLQQLFLDAQGTLERLAEAEKVYDQRVGKFGDNWVDRNSVGENMARLVNIIRMIYDTAPKPFQTPDNLEVIKDSIFGSLRTHKIRESDVTKEALEFGRQRQRLLLSNLRDVYLRISRDWRDITEPLKLEGELRFIHLTGSDFHNDGQSACILESDRGQKAVYKPRSLSPDTHLEGGHDSAHHALNEEHGLGLGTTAFIDKSDLGKEHGYMEFVPKVHRLTDEQATNYYLKMGRMVVTSKLLGVTDLHQENIMTSTDGNPIIIDAETSFLPNIMLSDAWDATGIMATLKTFTTENKLTPNYFYTEEELAEWQRDNPGEPDNGFITDKRNQSFREGGKYRGAYIRGIHEVLGIVNERKEAIKGFIIKLVRGVKNVRIVPLNTTEFVGPLSAFHRPGAKRDLIARIVQEDISASLTRDGYVMLEGSGKFIAQSILEDFMNTDIPLFHYQPRDNQVYYHHRPIAVHKVGLVETIERNVERISKTTAEEVIANLEGG